MRNFFWCRRLWIREKKRWSKTFSIVVFNFYCYSPFGFVLTFAILVFYNLFFRRRLSSFISDKIGLFFEYATIIIFLLFQNLLFSWIYFLNFLCILTIFLRIRTILIGWSSIWRFRLVFSWILIWMDLFWGLSLC